MGTDQAGIRIGTARFLAPGPLLPAAAVADGRLGVVGLAVLGGELDARLVRDLADVGGVDQQAFLAALEFEHELGDRGVGDLSKGRAEARVFGSLLVDGVDEADEDRVDLAVEVGDDVGEFAFATVGAEVDLAFQGPVEQRAPGFGPPEDRSFGQLPAANWGACKGWRCGLGR